MRRRRQRRLTACKGAAERVCLGSCPPQGQQAVCDRPHPAGLGSPSLSALPRLAAGVLASQRSAPALRLTPALILFFPPTGNPDRSESPGSSQPFCW